MKANWARSPVTLAAAALVGLGAALWGTVREIEPVLPADAVATVNGEPVPMSEYQGALQGFEAVRREPPGQGLRGEILDRLIDEELLVQRALTLGLAEDDPSVRKLLVRRMIETIVADAGAEPDEAELRAFFDENRDLFVQAPRLRVGHFPVADAASAEAARLALTEGQPFGGVETRYGVPEAVPTPEAPLPPSALQTYLGATLTEAVLSLAPGEWRGPVESGGRLHFVSLEERREASPPGFEAQRAEIEQAWRVRQGEEALHSYLGWLRERADIAIDKDALR